MDHPSQETHPGRSCGILLHVTSLPGPWGIGDAGPGACAWVDALARAKQRWWQILPLGPAGAGDSPYAALSAFAGNPLLISPDLLVRDGLAVESELRPPPMRPGRADYRAAARAKARLIEAAWARFQAGGSRRLRADFADYREANAEWLDDYALFMALKEAHRGRPWGEWPRDFARHKPAALRSAGMELEDAVGQRRFEQFLFDRQWGELRRYAAAQGVRLIGDLPIFVSGESADVWAHPELFRLDRSRRPTVVAGVPPDYFSRDGQRWGNPHYDWRAMQRDGYRWWIDRVRRTLAQVDLVRIDHFRGFQASWEVPASAPTARKGRWAKAPGTELFSAIRRSVGALPFIAEDLGVITPEVDALRDGLGLPGMRVLQFGFGGGDSPHLPHNHVPNSVVYTGTHDNDTTLGWHRSLHRRGRAHLRQYAPGADDDPAWTLIRLALGSVARCAIIPMQDVLRLGSAARMNVPGRAEGNWRWRLDDRQARTPLLDRLGGLTEAFGRA